MGFSHLDNLNKKDLAKGYQVAQRFDRKHVKLDWKIDISQRG